MLTVCSQLFSDSWIMIALILGVGIALAVFESLTQSSAADDE